MKKLITLLVLLSTAILCAQQNAYMLKDIYPGSTGASPGNLTVSGDLLYFRAAHPDSRTNVWVTDGTAEGTKLVKQISETVQQDPNNLHAFDGRCVFTQRNNEGRFLWITDGTEENTYKISPEGATDFHIPDFPVFKNHFYFTARVGPDRFYRTDGSEQEPEKIDWEYLLLNANQTIIIDVFTPCNDRAYFMSRNEPHYYDSVKDSVYKLLDYSFIGNGSFPQNMVCNENDSLYYNSFHPASGRQLMVDTSRIIIRDGVQNPFHQVHTYTPFSFLNNVMLFFADDGEHGTELWRTDGTQEGTFMVKDINTGSASSYAPSQTSSNPYRFFFPIGDGSKMLFLARTEEHGIEWHITDGTAEGTQLVVDLREGSQIPNITNITAHNGKVYFSCSIPGSQRELWVSDGTAEGTKQLTSIRQGSGNAFVSQITPMGNKLYFVADDGVHGRELWVYEPNGEVSVSEIQLNNEIQIFPNPAHDVLHIQCDDVWENSIVQIFDLHGRLILEQKINQKTELLNISDFKNGLYLVKITNHKNYYSKKLIVSH